MKFKEHVKCIDRAVVDTLEAKQDFQPLSTSGRTFIVGSGSSYSQAIFLAQLLNYKTSVNAFYLNPYEFVRHTTVNPGDSCIHFSQEAKRNDNISPIAFAKSKGARTILFSSKSRQQLRSDVSAIVDELYWFAPETEKVLVASMSYISGYAAAINYVNSQIQYQKSSEPIYYQVDDVVSAMRKAEGQEMLLSNDFVSFLYAGFGKSVAVEGALKVNECYLRDSESYEIKHYSHGKHFVSWNQPRLFNVIFGEEDKDLVDVYKETIFESHHKINYLYSSLPRELRVFEWGAQMLWFIVREMDINDIELEDIPVRDKIRVPHEFSY